jgi:two-component system cell cycle sensor histidine kinase/response regulator CckA
MNTDSIIESSKAEETVLLIDDDEMVADVGEQILKNFGYGVVKANSGNGAIEVYRENQDRIDMVILDMILPDMGGGDTYDRLKEINPGIKVLLASGYDIDHQARDLLERGCDGFIQKPFNMDELLKKTREILASN